VYILGIYSGCRTWEWNLGVDSGCLGVYPGGLCVCLLGICARMGVWEVLLSRIVHKS
jgi:hypothetical protein